METIEYRTVDKSAWGDGPWQSEPDKKQWRDPATGLPCLLRRSPYMGMWCGYVGVTEGHPAYGKDYDAVPADVHGGLTFSAPCSGSDEADSICHKPGEGEPDTVWWLGFDAGHYRDIMPGHRAQMREIAPDLAAKYAFLDRQATYRDMAYMEKEVTNLAAQLAAMVGK